MPRLRHFFKNLPVDDGGEFLVVVVMKVAPAVVGPHDRLGWQHSLVLVEEHLDQGTFNN